MHRCAQHTTLTVKLTSPAGATTLCQATARTWHTCGASAAVAAAAAPAALLLASASLVDAASSATSTCTGDSALAAITPPLTAHKAPFSLRATPSRRGQAGAHRQQVQCQTPLQCILCGSHKKGVSPAAGQAGRGARARRPSRSMVTVTRRRRASSASAAARSCAFRASRSCACGACAPSRTPSALKSLPRTSAEHQRDGQLVHRSFRAQRGSRAASAAGLARNKNVQGAAPTTQAPPPR